MFTKTMKALHQKTTWMGLAIIVNGPLLAFGVPAKIVGGIIAIVGGLAIIFQRQATQKGQDKSELVQKLTDEAEGLHALCEYREEQTNAHH